MAEKYVFEVDQTYVITITLDQILHLLVIHRLSYFDPIDKKIEEAQAEVEKGFAEISRAAEQRIVRIKTNAIDSPMSIL